MGRGDDAVQQTPLVLAAGLRLRPGVAIQAVGQSLDRLRYREFSTEEPGEFTAPATVVFRHLCGNPFPEAFLPSTEPDESCGSGVASWAPGHRPAVTGSGER